MYRKTIIVPPIMLACDNFQFCQLYFQHSYWLNPEYTQWLRVACYWLFFVGMRLFCTLLYVKVVIHSTWTSGKEWAPYITRRKDQQMHRNHCLRAVGGAWRNQTVCYCPGIQAHAGRSVSVELRMWWEWCTTSRKTPMVGMIHIYDLDIFINYSQ